jgi:hypothetical protein
MCVANIFPPPVHYDHPPPVPRQPIGPIPYAATFRYASTTGKQEDQTPIAGIDVALVSFPPVAWGVVVEMQKVTAFALNTGIAVS